MRGVELRDDEVLVSYDVKSLFTNVPVNESIAICEKRLQEDESLKDRTEMSVETIIKLLSFCLTSTTFVYKGQHYQQLDGVAMGSPVSPVIADLFMEDFEMKAFNKYSKTPRLWERFVDDILAIVEKTRTKELLEYLNNQHDRIQFTMEEEQEGSLPFMDVRFIRESHGELGTEVYKKPTHTNRYVQFDSHQPIGVKSGVVQCLASRAIMVSSSEKKQRKEFCKIKKALAGNGYPKKFVERAINKQIRRQGLKGNNKKQDDGIKSKTIARILFIDGISQEVKWIMREANVKCVFSNDSTLESLYCYKDPLPSEKQQNVVYAIKCRTCDEEYIGETRRALAVRVREQKDATRLDQSSKSAVAEHVHNHDVPHCID